MHKRLTMKYPSSWHGDMWREAAPCGNGVVGAAVYGGIKKEIIMLNHAKLWRGSKTTGLPDISGSLEDIRAALAGNDPVKADSILADRLREQGYDGEPGMPLPLGDLTILSASNELFRHYRREIDLDQALVTVRWEEGEAAYCRSTFVSRASGLIFTRISCSRPLIDITVTLSHHDPESIGDYLILGEEQHSRDGSFYYAAYNDSEFSGGDYGAVCKAITKGKVEAAVRYDHENSSGIPVMHISGTDEVLLVTRVFLMSRREEEFAAGTGSGKYEFGSELERHTKLHQSLYGRVDFSISGEKHRCNEELLLEAYDKGASAELTEKLYAYGRYLFICAAAAQDSLPCHLAGLWNGTYQCFWAFYMYNINYQMIYWQALAGNLPELLRSALDYTESQIEDYKENAQKLFGCRGIYINSVNTPESGLSKNNCNHILNWTAGAAWFSQHYWDYCGYTGDIRYMSEHALPFMYQAALFYEDFLQEGPDGYLVFAPSVSPENTPGNIIHKEHREIETSVNAVMDIAIVKELLQNLITGSHRTGMYREKIAVWESMIKKLPPYRVNEDGAVKEWSHEFYKDHYHHRHHSHLYPVFPGREITGEHPLYPAFVRAEDMRLKYGLSSQSSWSMVFMAGIAARMGKGNRAEGLLDILARTCLINNLFTVHNDWRRTGPVYCDDFRPAPFQIDANIGIPGVINEMLLFSDEETLVILPALPSKWEQGHIDGLLAQGGIICNIRWTKECVQAELSCTGEKTRKIRYGNTTRQVEIKQRLLLHMNKQTEEMVLMPRTDQQ